MAGRLLHELDDGLDIGQHRPCVHCAEFFSEVPEGECAVRLRIALDALTMQRSSDPLRVAWRELAEAIRTHKRSPSLFATLSFPDVVADLDASERVNAALLGLDHPWSVLDVLSKLADAAEHLRDVHDCDAHGYEEVKAAAEAARAHVARIQLFVAGVRQREEGS